MVHLLDRKDLMTTAEVAKYLHIKPKTVTVWLREGCLPGIKLKTSGQWRVSPERLHLWEKQQEN
jgi:excisionase family DNA binding protein